MKWFYLELLFCYRYDKRHIRRLMSWSSPFDILVTRNISIKEKKPFFFFSIFFSLSTAVVIQKDVLFNRLRFSTKESFSAIKTNEVLNEFQHHCSVPRECSIWRLSEMARTVRVILDNFEYLKSLLFNIYRDKTAPSIHFCYRKEIGRKNFNPIVLGAFFVNTVNFWRIFAGSF